MLDFTEQAQAHRQIAEPTPAAAVSMSPKPPNVPGILQHIKFNLYLPSVILHMSPGYDYNRFTPDPDEAFSELAQDFDKVVNEFRGIRKQPERSQEFFEQYKRYLRDALVRMVHTSNALENAGVGFDVTNSLVDDMLSGMEMSAEIGEDDARYKAIVDHLSQKRADTSYHAVQQAFRQVIQHVYAVFYIIEQMIVQDKLLSEALLQQTHRILTDGINAENSESDPSTAYGGTYRTDDVGWTPFSSFAAPSSIPYRVASTITELNTTIQRSESTMAIDPYQLASKTSHKLLTIHPFLDGNSRVSRIVLNTVLLKYTCTMIPFGRDPIEAAKWKETVARAAEMEVEIEDMGGEYYKDFGHGDKGPWKEVATLVLIQGRREMGNLREILLTEAKQGKKRTSGADMYPWEGETDDPFVREMEKRMGRGALLPPKDDEDLS
ncbi:hypothetical protein ONS95_013283 [Cadophora gregata]|uniref:uncharacterized protein n=1 Tax=Cadophora gregata TaxID=51156 RepID=UPI0026DB409E|nr:uncharacterized protein ONS95_013283 [Cadophora gregata]KAK0099893.1 hypothetical protein ONS96_007842 [Cadophora gregata f. sp. sojae]KAK0116257.1 hypothetical protein ONS95_013283 [Cadophora gregata]